VRTISVQQRRQALVRRHRLRGDATGPEDVTAALIALHATDPASVYLSVLARSNISSLADVSAAMYERRSLVRWLAMRRTLFLFLTHDVPLIQAAVSTPLAGALRRQLVGRLQRNGTEPAIDGDVSAWLTGVQAHVERSLYASQSATGAQVSADVPTLGTSIRPRAPSDRPQNLTSALLTIMSAQGRIVRCTPTGPWTSRQHRWEPVDRWWPQGLPEIGTADAQQALARRWLERFGPATAEDLQWWTGWSKTTVASALRELAVEEVDLHGESGIALPVGDGPPAVPGEAPAEQPAAALLPALDPTPMGWKHRAWFLSLDPRQIFDTAGNIGPTLWWDGEIIGSWAVAASGEIRTHVALDRGSDAAGAVEAAAANLHRRLDGTVVTPAVRTPLERSLL